MEHENRRQWERFAYPTELQLTAAGHVLPAKLIDVSPQGMQVVAPVLLHAGDEVSASLPATLQAQGAAGPVRGRVCWTAPARADGTPQTRAGILFEAPLSAARAPQGEAGRNVIVQFSGAMPQLMARAMQSDSGLRLSFALPFLRQGSVITLHSQDDVPKEMRVVGARLDDSSAQVELQVEPCAETRKRRFVQYDELEKVQPLEAERAPEPTLPKRRVLAGVGMGASLAAACWIGLRVTQPHREATAEAPHEIAQAAINPQLVTAPDHRAAPAPHTIAVAALSGTETPAPAPPPKPSAPRTIAVTTNKDTSEIFVPVTGSVAGLATKIWTDPPAVVVEIPRGQIALGQKHFDIQKDGVLGISVGRPGGVTQLRVYVNSILSQYSASAVPGGVSVRIKRDLQSP